jgi:hypothetical protein
MDVQENAHSREGSAVLMSSPEQCCCSLPINQEVTTTSGEISRGLPEPPMPILPATAVYHPPAYILVPVGPGALLTQQYGMGHAEPALGFGSPSESQPWYHKPVTIFEGHAPQSAIQAGAGIEANLSVANLNSIFGDDFDTEESAPCRLP